MTSVLSELGGIAGNAAGEAVAFGLGFALGRVLDPPGTTLSQQAWKDALDADPGLRRAVDAVVAAQIVAEDVADAEWGASEARQHGIDSDTFDKIVGEVLNAPGMGELLQAARRGTITPEQFTHGLRKAKLETLWDAALTDLQHERLDPSALATAIHRGIIAGQGLIVTEPPSGSGSVPHVPESSIDAVKEAAAQGYDAERLRVLVGNTGLPLSLGEMLQLRNRGKVNDDDVKRSVAQSNVRNEYMDVALELRRRLLTPHEYAELALRGYITDAQRDAGAALSGLESADTQLLFNMLGRSLAVHQVTTGLARGGKYGGNYESVPEPYLSALRQSNVKPPWGNIAYANRYNYPSAFVLRALTQAKELTEEEAHQILLNIGWEPTLAAKVAKTWAGGTAAKGDTHVSKAETQVWTALHKSYVDNLSTDAETTADLATLGVAQPSIPEVVALWQAERAIVRRSLTPAQIKKAIGEPGRDAAWASNRLLELGYSAEDAATFLAE